MLKYLEQWFSTFPALQTNRGGEKMVLCEWQACLRVPTARANRATCMCSLAICVVWFRMGCSPVSAHELGVEDQLGTPDLEALVSPRFCLNWSVKHSKMDYKALSVTFKGISWYVIMKKPSIKTMKMSCHQHGHPYWRGRSEHKECVSPHKLCPSSTLCNNLHFVMISVMTNCGCLCVQLFRKDCCGKGLHC